MCTTAINKRLVVGRVQTPTLAMLVEREGKITTFRKEKYFNMTSSLMCATMKTSANLCSIPESFWYD